MGELKEAFDLGGNGAVFEKLIPPELQAALRTIIGSFKSLWGSLTMIAGALKPIAQAFGGALLGALATLLPIIAGVVRAIALLTQWMLQNEPVVKALAYAIIGLNVAALVSRAIVGLVVAVRALSIAAVVAQAINLLSNSIIRLAGSMSKNPVIAIITIVVASLLALALSSRTAQKWMESLMARLSQLAGFDMGKILSPGDSNKELEDWADKYNGALQDISKGMDGVNGEVDENGDALDDAAKKAKKFLAAFDEVFQIPEKEEEDKLPEIPGTLPGDGEKYEPPEMPKIEVPELPELPDWSDWLPDFPLAIELPKFTWPFKWSLVLEPLERFQLSFKLWWESLPATVRGWLPNFEFELGRLPKFLRGWVPVIEGILGGLPKFLRGWVPVLEGILGNLPDFGMGRLLEEVQGWVKDVAGAFNGLFPQFQPQWQGTWTNIPTVVSAALGAISGAIASFGASTLAGWNSTWGTIGDTVTGIMEGLVANMPVWGAALTAGVAVVGVAISTGWATVTSTVGTALSGIGTSISTHTAAWATAIGTSLAAIGIAFSTSWNNFTSSASTALTNIGTNISTQLATWGASFTTGLTAMGLVFSTAWSLFTKNASSSLASIGIAIVTQLASWGKSFSTGLTAISDQFSKWGTILGAAGTIIWSLMKEGFKTMMKSIGDGISNGLKAIKNFWEDHKKTILLVVGGLVLAIVLAFVGVPTGILAAIGGLLVRLGPALMRIGPLFMTAIKGIPGLFRTIFSKLPPSAQGFVSSIIKYFKDLPGRIMDAIRGIPDMVMNLFKKIKLPDLGGLGEKISGAFGGGPVTGFATGGIINRDSIVRVGEGGRREAIIPLQNGDAMRPFADAVAARMMNQLPRQQGSRGGEPIQQIIQVGTLIADDRSLKELERRMKVVRIGESKRGG
jgi:hypothetical protein